MSLGTPIRLVWEAYHKGVTLLAVPETPTDTIHPPKITAEIFLKERKDGRSDSRGSFSFKCDRSFIGRVFRLFLVPCQLQKKTKIPKNQTKTFKTAEPLSARTSDTQLLIARQNPWTQQPISKQQAEHKRRKGRSSSLGRTLAWWCHTQWQLPRHLECNSGWGCGIFPAEDSGDLRIKLPRENRGFLGLKNLKPPQKKNRSCSLALFLQLTHLH